MKTTSVLRALLRSGDLLMVPGAYDALSARVLEQAGFNAVYMSGYAVSASLLCLPDAGLITLSEMVQTAAHMTSAIEVPLIADADTGFGNAVNVCRTVKEFVRAGVASVQLEDQVMPKRCGHVAGKEVLPLAEAVGKIQAAVDTRDELDQDFVIIARTDARGVSGGTVEMAIERGRAFADAGADVVFLEALASVQELQQAVEAIEAPILYNVAGLSPKLSAKELTDLGVAIALYPTLSIRAVLLALWRAASRLSEVGTVAYEEITNQLEVEVGNIDVFLSFSEVRTMEQKYLPPQAMEKYLDSLGFEP